MNDYKVIRIDERTRKVTINPPFPPKKISGIDKLIQTVVLAIFNTPGRDVFNPERGSGLPDLIGTNFNPNDPQEATAEVTERIEKIREEIIEDQNALTEESPSELLADLQVLSVDTGINIDSLEVELRLISQSGQSSTIVL